MKEREIYLKKATLVTHIYDNADFPKRILRELFQEEDFSSESLEKFFIDFESIKLPTINASNSIILQYAYDAFLTDETKLFVDKVFGSKDLFLKGDMYEFRDVIYAYEKELSDEQFETLYKFKYQKEAIAMKYRWFINQINKIFEKGYKFIYNEDQDIESKRSRLRKLLSIQYKPDIVENMHKSRIAHVQELGSSYKSHLYEEKCKRKRIAQENFRNYIIQSYPLMTGTNIILDTIIHAAWLYWAAEICMIPKLKIQQYVRNRCHPMLINSYLSLANEIFYYMNLNEDIVEVVIDNQRYKAPKYLLIISDNNLIKYLTSNGLSHENFRIMDDNRLNEISNIIHVNMKTLHSIQDILNKIKENNNYMHELFTTIEKVVNYPPKMFKEDYS